MKGAIFFSGQYGSTAHYSQWLSEATGLPVYDVKQPHPALSEFDFLVLGSSVIIGKLTIHKWVKHHIDDILTKPIAVFSVAGAPPGPERNTWIANSLPEALVAKMQHVALRGRLDINNVGWWTRLVLKIGAWATKDDQEKREMTQGFDFMNKADIEPLVKFIKQLQSNEKASVEQSVPC